jgi:hypothetical protein
MIFALRRHRVSFDGVGGALCRARASLRTVGLAALDRSRNRLRLILGVCQKDYRDLLQLLATRQDDQLLDPVTRDAEALEVGG